MYLLEKPLAFPLFLRLILFYKWLETESDEGVSENLPWQRRHDKMNESSDQARQASQSGFPAKTRIDLY